MHFYDNKKRVQSGCKEIVASTKLTSTLVQTNERVKMTKFPNDDSSHILMDCIDSERWHSDERTDGSYIREVGEEKRETKSSQIGFQDFSKFSKKSKNKFEKKPVVKQEPNRRRATERAIHYNKANAAFKALCPAIIKPTRTK
ncbi:hypothetical protein T02_13507 [Trichinella nativa]|uniref:Uncharacterized protein n=1 Tax=Trichinella nativa TaxID=6335 RepID=A0A0V1LGT3_9BILA|nr:hypothetical protein T02_13507 [Trichinella nativa]